MSDEPREYDHTSDAGSTDPGDQRQGAAPHEPVNPAAPRPPQGSPEYLRNDGTPPPLPSQYPPAPPQNAPADPHTQQQTFASADATAREKLPAPLAAKEPWLAAFASAGLALAGALAASIVITVLALFGGRLFLGEYGGPEFLEAVGPHWFAIIAQLLGAGFGGALGGSAEFFGAASFRVSVAFIPALVPIATLVSVRLFAKRAAPRINLETSWRLVVSAAAGIAFALVVVMLQLVAPLAISIPGASVELTFRAISAWSIIVGIVLVGAATFFALSPKRATRGRARTGFIQALEHLGALGVLVALALIVVVAWNAEGAGQVFGLILLAPLILPFLAADGGAIATLANVGTSMRGGSSLDMLGGLGDIADELPSVWMFSEALPLWARIALPIVAVIALAIASVRWRIRRGVDNDAVSWALLPVAYGVLGVIATLIGRASVSASASAAGDFGSLLEGGLGGSVHVAFGPAVWTFVLFAAVGIIVEVLARFVVPAPPAGPPAQADPALFAAHPAPAVPPALPYAPAPADPVVAMLAGGTQEHKPVSKKAKVGWIVGGSTVAVIAILLIAGAVVKNQLASTTYSAETRAEEYLSAIVNGDADRALRLWAPNVTSAERVLLTSDIYAAAENRPTAYEVTGLDEFEGVVDVSAQLTVDSKHYEVHLRLQKDGTQAVFFDDWRVVEGPSQALVVGDVSRVSKVNGVDVDLSEFADAAGGGMMLPVLPGTYTFEAPAGVDGPFTYGDDVQVTVLPNAGGTDQVGTAEAVTFRPTWTSDAQEQAIATVQERIDLCMTSDRFQPSDCTNVLGWNEPFYAVTGITRSWTEEPTLTFVDDEGAAYVLVEGGEMHIDFQQRWLETDDWEDDEVDVYSPFNYGTAVPVAVGDDGAVAVDLSGF